MIEICYDPEGLCMTLRGHAGAGVPGQDLICCAASMLTYTLAANVRRMHKRGWLESGRIRLRPGDAEISCVPKKEARDMVVSRVDAICVGFLLLAREYPDFVRFQIHNKEVTNGTEGTACASALCRGCAGG